jgi:hypothetical protein
MLIQNKIILKSMLKYHTLAVGIRFGQDNFELTMAVAASTFLKEQSLLSFNLLTDCLINLWIDQGFNRGQEAQGWTSERGSEAQAWRGNKRSSKCTQTKTHLSATEKI